MESTPDPQGESRFRAEARFYSSQADGSVRCALCPHGCLLSEGARGLCGVRENRAGRLETLVYGRVCAAHVDPVEKKPFYHLLPGARAFSLATAGCNVHCRFCQNWEIAQARPEALPARYLSPREAAALARRQQCALIACTYTEPTVYVEYALDVAEAAQELGLLTALVTNGYTAPEARRELYGRMDAVKIDLKGFTEGFYRRVVGAELRPVLDSLEAARAMERHLEIVYLLLPGLNDSDEELTAMTRWVAAHLGPEVPLHFSRFFPHYKMRELPATPVAGLERARRLALGEGISYVYLGNLPGHEGEDTRCPDCHALLVERSGGAHIRVAMDEGRCPLCRRAIAGLWRGRMQERGE